LLPTDFSFEASQLLPEAHPILNAYQATHYLLRWLKQEAYPMHAEFRAALLATYPQPYQTIAMERQLAVVSLAIDGQQQINHLLSLQLTIPAPPTPELPGPLPPTTIKLALGTPAKPTYRFTIAAITLDEAERQWQAFIEREVKPRFSPPAGHFQVG
jgi:hypothetical protein